MNQLRRHIALLFVFVICILTNAQAQLLTYKSISTEDGLLSNEVNMVKRDSKGYVWIGTKNGLCRWDSRNFEYFTIEDGLPNNEILYLYEDAEGRMWISCFSQELCFFLKGKIHNRKNTPFLNKIKIYPGGMLIEQHKDFYYVSVDGRMNIFNTASREMTISGSMLPPFIYTMYKGKVVGVQNVKWGYTPVQKKQTLIWSRDTVYYVPYYLYPNIPDYDILTRVDFENKTYGFQHGLDTPFYQANYTDKNLRGAVYNNGKILEIYKDKIIQTRNHYQLKLNHVSRVNVFSINNKLFVGSTAGLLVCSQVPLLEYEQDPAINNSASFVFKYGKEIYFVNNEYQLIRLADQKKVNRFKDNAINLYNLLAFKNRFYVTTSFDVYQFAAPEDAISTYQCRLSWVGSNFKYISPSKKSDCLFAANGGRLGILLLNVRTRACQPVLVDTQKNVYSVYEDSKSRLWYSTTNKVYYTNDYYNGVKESREFVLDATSPLFCKSIQEDNKGNLFFITNGGIFVYDGKNKYRIDRQNLLSDDECNRIAIDTLHSSFWVATKNGLNQIGYTKQGGSLKFTVLSKFFATDGLRSDNINDLLLDSNKLYIATDKGVNMLDDVLYRPDTLKVPVYIKLLAVNATPGKSYDTVKTIQLEHDQNNLTIGFSAIYFLRRERLKVKAWLYRNHVLVSENEITGDKIDYYSLNDGDYKLILQAFDQDYPYIKGRSEPFEFTIKPPYYKTWWFMIGASLCTITIITISLLWNLNRRKKRMEMQAKLNESTLKSLQNQMNPHFVFNSLNTIQSFITDKNEEGAIDYLSEFSGLMREMLEQSAHTFISLEHEIQFLHKYVQLEITRFKGSFDVEWHIDLDEEDLTDITIPTMLIQPVLENAVKHGVSGLNGVRGRIDVSFGLANEYMLKVVIKDNGKPAPHKIFKGNAIAVKTIRERLGIYTRNGVKGQYHLQLSETGATAILTIPV